MFEHYRSYLPPDTDNGLGFVVDRATFDAARRRDGALMIGSAEQRPRRSSTRRPSSGITRFIGSSDWADSRPLACTSIGVWRPRSRPPYAPPFSAYRHMTRPRRRAA